MKVRMCVIGACCLVAVAANQRAERLLNEPEKYYRAAGVFEEVGGVTEVSLRNGQRVDLQGIQRNGNWRYCLVWQTQFGPDSVTVLPYVGKNKNDMRRVVSQDVCAKGEHYQFMFISQREQVIRINMPLDRFGHYVPNAGTTRSICNRCDPIPSFAEVSSPEPVLARGYRFKFVAITSAIAGLLTLLTLPVVLGVLYNIFRSLFPTERARLLHQEVELAARGKDFDTGLTSAYRDAPKNPLRQRQDIDDMREITKKIRAETSRNEELVQKKLNEAQDKIARKKAAVQDYEAKVAKAQRIEEALRRQEKNNETK